MIKADFIIQWFRQRKPIKQKHIPTNTIIDTAAIIQNALKQQNLPNGELREVMFREEKKDGNKT